jgi:REP element-mobilizing transposase RayT
MKRRRPVQLELTVPPGWGGARAGAGRKPLKFRIGPPHRRRPEHELRHPLHVTLRTLPMATSLRSELLFPRLSRALGASTRDGFRILHFSVQSDHLHLMAEADTQEQMSRGMQGLAVRCAKTINLAAGRRGTVWRGRYHLHALTTPREVRTAIVYVLLNFRKHLQAGPGIDPCSSGPWFDGWAHRISPP